jgi:hypothetical protein
MSSGVPSALAEHLHVLFVKRAAAVNRAGTPTRGPRRRETAYGSGLQYMSRNGWLGRMAQSGCWKVVDTASRPFPLNSRIQALTVDNRGTIRSAEPGRRQPPSVIGGPR